MESMSEPVLVRHLIMSDLRGPTFLGACREERGKGRPFAGGLEICGVMGNPQSFSAVLGEGSPPWVILILRMHPSIAASQQTNPLPATNTALGGRGTRKNVTSSLQVARVAASEMD
jgi:hypothetical protein